MTNLDSLRGHLLSCVLVLITVHGTQAQQDPQYTHYQYNTLIVNPAYTGSREHFAATLLYRDQWLTLEGAPRTITLGLDMPLGYTNGVGITAVQDEIGPATETYLDLNIAHHLYLNSRGARLSIGLKGGGRMLDVDWSRGLFREPDAVFNENLNSELLPVIGAGAYFYTDRSYLGVSIPNFLNNERYNELEERVGVDQMHLYIMGGYVFSFGSDIKFKPSTLVRLTNGSPMIFDASLNFLIVEKLTIGVNYRWDDSVSGLFGFQITPGINIGYAYDHTLSDLGTYNTGSHEVLLRFELKSKDKILKSPRFF